MAQTQAERFPALCVVLERSEKLNLLKNEDLQKIEDALNVKAQEVINAMNGGQSLESLLGVDHVPAQSSSIAATTEESPADESKVALVVVNQGSENLIPLDRFNQLREETGVHKGKGFRVRKFEGKSMIVLSDADLKAVQKVVEIELK